MNNFKITYFMVLIPLYYAYSQRKLEFSGQISGLVNYNTKSQLDYLAAGRYIPELNYKVQLDSIKTLDIEASANISGATMFQTLDNFKSTGSLKPYRVWARYASEQYEIRLGLQKIDFGSASIIRPLQWFNQIDPRDPLQLTNGVYAGLGRYYFLNNANIWIWVLYANEERRGFDSFKTNAEEPEFGGRLQHPVPKGEIAFSYHHRTAESHNQLPIPEFERIPEDRFGMDAKWDIEIGLWVEASYVQKHKNVGFLTHQTLLNIGLDYTLAIGSGLNVAVEHLISSFDNRPIHFDQTNHISAATLSYPLGFFDKLSAVAYNNWISNDFSIFLNYEHQFKHFTGYVMGYYNSGSNQQSLENEFTTSYSGPGMQLMIVYNH